jgi:hypothetical protein
LLSIVGKILREKAISSMNVSILKDLERLKLKHATSKVSSTSFQPDEKQQKVLKVENQKKREEEKALIEKKLKEKDESLKEQEKEKSLPMDGQSLDSNMQQVSGRVSTAPAYASIGRATKLFPGTGSRPSSREVQRPHTAGADPIVDQERIPFNEALKYLNDTFKAELQHCVVQEANDAKKIFDSVVQHYKGGVVCQFSPKRPFEVIDISALPSSRDAGISTGGTLKLEDINNIKKKDGMALFFDPCTNVSSCVVEIRCYFQKAIDLVSEESCAKCYQFHSNGNYFSLTLSEESSCSGGARSSSPVPVLPEISSPGPASSQSSQEREAVRGGGGGGGGGGGSDTSVGGYRGIGIRGQVDG